MSPGKLKRFETILKKLNIKTDYNDFENLMIKNVKVNVLNKSLMLELVSDFIFNKAKFDNIITLLKDKLTEYKHIEYKIKFNVTIKDKNTLIKEYLPNIFFLIEREIPSSTAWINETDWYINNDFIIFEFKSDVAVYTLQTKKMDEHISNILLKELGVDLNVKFKNSITNSVNKEDHYKIKEQEEALMLENVKINSNVEKENIDKSKTRKIKNGNILFGSKFDGEVKRISEIDINSGNVIIEGEIFNIETKDIKGDKKLYTFNITDYTSSITVKVFITKKYLETFESNVREKAYVKLCGDVIYDNFSKQIVIMLKSMSKLDREQRIDKSIDKRVELHCHTRMSAMDGITTFSDLAKRASEWGHKALAITDHGVVQSFPEGMDAAKKYGIKVLYGVEGYLVNDSKPVVLNASDQKIDCEYTVFDIETTGLSSKNDRITEIGAVKVKEGKIIDRFTQLINPLIKIPDRIVKLTGITDELVKDKPTIEEVLPKFINFVGDSVLVAHNAPFDMGFIKVNCKRMGITIDNAVLDTLQLCRGLFPQLKSHKLNVIAKHLKIKLENHHRAVDDSEATAYILFKCIDLLVQKGIKNLSKINETLSDNSNIKSGDTNHVIIFAKNYNGLKMLYKIISESHLKYFYRRPRIPKSYLAECRDDLIIGSACEAGELYRAILQNKDYEELKKIANFYDYLEIQPIGNNRFLIDNQSVKDEDELKNINMKIVEIGEKLGKPVVATCDVHFLDPRDEIYRRILMSGQGFSDADNQAPLYFRTTDEMLDEFEYLGDKAKEVVIHNTNIIAEMIDEITPIPDGTFPPVIDGAEEELRNMNYKKAKDIYGDPLPDIVKTRLDRELNSIISNGYAVMYIIAQKLVTKSLKDGYLVGSRGSVGSSLVATMSDITEVNPLPPHYVCPQCKNSEFFIDGSIGSGADLPNKNCPKCGAEYKKDGHDIPFEVFLGFEGDKEPDIDLNFAGEYQSVAHKYTEELFGEGYVFRAGTIGTVAEKTAYGFVKKYYEERNMVVNNAEISRLVKGCTGIKRTSGQHPGGIMVVPRYKDIHDFSPIQYPADDKESGVITTHFDYHSISGRILKLDILGHDVPSIIRMLEDLTGLNAQSIPLGDTETMKIFTSPEPLGVKSTDINSKVGTLGIPEFGTKFVRQMLVDTIPTTFAELVRISGLSHGTDVWLNNAQELVRNGTAILSNVISTRDDIMQYLINKGLDKKKSFKIMEKVRKGKGLTEEDEKYMRDNKVPEWYIDSCKKIKYMFPKAHAVAYVMMSFRIAYYKLHYPEAFYATYFTSKAVDFDAELIVKGKESIQNKIDELDSMGNNKTAKEKNLLTVLEVALEMYCRGFKFEKVDLYKSDSDKFLLGDNGIIPPLKSLQGVGENAARSIALERNNGQFISIEDLTSRCKVTKTVIEALKNHGCLDHIPESNQLSLFNI